jgi:cell division protein ZapA
VGQVTIRVGGYSHPVACQDGQEEHLQRMAAEVDRRIGALRAMGMQFGEARMLLLAALQLADETSDLREELEALKAGRPMAAAAEGAAADPRLAEWLNRLAERIEGIAAALEAA